MKYRQSANSASGKCACIAEKTWLQWINPVQMSVFSSLVEVNIPYICNVEVGTFCWEFDAENIVIVNGGSV